MGYRSSEIEVTTTIDLCDYDDEVLEYIEPDNISDALELMERWGYSEGDFLRHMLDQNDNEFFLEQVSDILTVATALQLVNDVYDMGKNATEVRETNMRNQIADLRLKVQELEKANGNNTV
tara:strand:- start:407 stop:769 length:363 start_codon:yes stop_codon:yes gene_type:complete